MIDVNGDYVVLDGLNYSSTGRYLAPAINKNISQFKLERQLKTPNTYLFRFDK